MCGSAVSESGLFSWCLAILSCTRTAQFLHHKSFRTNIETGVRRKNHVLRRDVDLKQPFNEVLQSIPIICVHTYNTVKNIEFWLQDSRFE